MAKKIAVFNQKGGVGKTTTIINLANALSQKGNKVLICDVDPQANSTSGIGIETEELEKSVYDSLIGSSTPQDVVLKTNYDNLHILPSSPDLAGLEVELAPQKRREFKLKEILSELDSFYNYIFIDCPPSLGLLSVNALVAADALIIPIQCEYYSLEGVSQLLYTMQQVKSNINHKLVIEGVLLTMVDKRTNLSSQVAADVRRYFKDLVYKTEIPRNIRLAEAPSFKKTVIDYDRNSSGAKAYLNLAEEFIKKQG